MRKKDTLEKLYKLTVNKLLIECIFEEFSNDFRKIYEILPGGNSPKDFWEELPRECLELFLNKSVQN